MTGPAWGSVLPRARKAVYEGVGFASAVFALTHIVEGRFQASELTAFVTSGTVCSLFSYFGWPRRSRPSPEAAEDAPDT